MVIACVCRSRAGARGLQLDCETCSGWALDGKCESIVLVGFGALTSKSCVEIAAGCGCEGHLLVHSVDCKTCCCSIVTSVLPERVEMVCVVGVIIDEEI
jgi:hypothetical protein